ncbi:hypothetical protein QUA81_25900 [Microcoleus sp. F6_B4]
MRYSWGLGIGHGASGIGHRAWGMGHGAWGILTKNFKGGTRHVIYPWNQSKIENRKSLHPPHLSRASQSKI